MMCTRAARINHAMNTNFGKACTGAPLTSDIKARQRGIALQCGRQRCCTRVAHVISCVYIVQTTIQIRSRPRAPDGLDPRAHGPFRSSSVIMQFPFSTFASDVTPASPMPLSTLSRTKGGQ
jgi:hypothetical protein